MAQEDWTVVCEHVSYQVTVKREVIVRAEPDPGSGVDGKFCHIIAGELAEDLIRLREANGHEEFEEVISHYGHILSVQCAVNYLSLGLSLAYHGLMSLEILRVQARHTADLMMTCCTTASVDEEARKEFREQQERFRKLFEDNH